MEKQKQNMTSKDWVAVKELNLSYSGALADRIWNFGNSQIEYFFA